MSESSIDGELRPPASILDLELGLQRLGYRNFRPGQRQAVETLLSEARLLLVAPTGGGKSLIYQLPAVLLQGTTLVISPLISLMTDQVAALEARGVSATFLASTLDAAEIRRRMSAIAQGRFDLVFVAPERLSFPGFRSILADLNCPLIAIDEAHCISEWGHDFRPEYLQIGQMLKDFPDSRILACTATATPVVRDEIIERLALPAKTKQLIYGFARPNLSLRVREVRDKRERENYVDSAIAEALGKPGEGRGAAILYCPTRKATEVEARRMLAKGWKCMAYHAGLGGPRREEVQAAFFSGELEMVAATNAFGMGIDRADVRAVVHLAPPGSIEAYYQEVGRAGRDGNDAIGAMVVSPGDMARRRSLLDLDQAGGGSAEHMVEHKWGMFLELMRFAEGGSCRHDTVLRYFDDEAETLAGCGRCDVCEQFSDCPEDDDERDAEETTLIVRKALSAVARVHGRFGLSAAVALLRGAKDPRLQRSGLERTPTFGVLRGRAEDWLTRLLRRCVTAGWVDFIGLDRPVVVLTDAGVEVMHAQRPVRLLLPPTRTWHPPKFARPHSERAGTPRPAVDHPAEEDSALFEALREYRLGVATAQGKPPYLVASDRTLREIAAGRPKDLDALLLVHGIGPAKAKLYGPGLLAVVRGRSDPS